MAEVSLSLRGFAYETERVLAGDADFIRYLFAYFLADGFDMRHDAVDILARMGTVVVGLEQDDMGTGLTGDIGTDLRFVGFFFEHGDWYQETAQRFDGHRGGDKDIGTPFIATFVQMLLNNAFIVRTLNQPYIVIIIPDHYQ